MTTVGVMAPHERGRLAFETFLAWQSGRARPIDPNEWDMLAPNIQQAWTKVAMTIADDVKAEAE